MKQNTEDYSYCHVVGQTDIGKRRKANEDNGGHFVTINGLVSVVCDGMGGHVGGAVASATAVEAIHEFLECQYYDDPREAIGLAIQAANEAIIRKTEKQPELSGMGSTCVLLLVRDGKVYIGHVGDSRIYLIREKNIIQLTKDHSFVQTLVDMGHITKEEAEHHPRKNEITNALGLPEMSPATVRNDAIEPQAGDCFLLCSDGLSGMVSDRAIERIVSKQREYTSQQRADMLVQAANANGGADNITVELVEFAVSPSADIRKTSGISSKMLYAILVFIVLFILGGGTAAYLFFSKSSCVEKYINLQDIEVISNESITIFRLSPRKDNNYVFESCLPDKDIRYVLNDVVEDGISSNLDTGKSDEFRVFSVPEGFAEDSMHITIPCADTIYKYSAKVILRPAEHIMKPITFSSNGSIATIQEAEKGNFILNVIGEKQARIIQARRYQIHPLKDLVLTTEAGKTNITFGKKFLEKEIRISFEGENDTNIYIIPVETNEQPKKYDSSDKKSGVVVPVQAIPETPATEDISIELEISDYAGKEIEITTSYVGCNGQVHEFEGITSLEEEYRADENIRDQLEQTGYDDGKSLRLRFKDTAVIAPGRHTIDFSCKNNNSTGMKLILILNVK